MTSLFDVSRAAQLRNARLSDDRPIRFRCVNERVQQPSGLMSFVRMVIARLWKALFLTEFCLAQVVATFTNTMSPKGLDKIPIRVAIRKSQVYATQA